jgi:hypothetical protein
VDCSVDRTASEVHSEDAGSVHHHLALPHPPTPTGTALDHRHEDSI